MTSHGKITASHLGRDAFVYVRQSTVAQVEHNRESTERQYKLVERARQLGWHSDQIQVIDQDLGVSGAGTADRSGFAELTTTVALGQAGIVFGLEVSRLARNNADWYRLLDICGITDTLIGDADGIYHPSLYNDRLVLGLKGTMSEAELHILRARLLGGIRNKAERGELRRGLPVGFVWGDEDGEILLHPDEAVTGAIRAVFERFAELGSARQVWLWLRSEKIELPLQSNQLEGMRWVTPTYAKVHQILTNPVYAGAYVYGKTRQERYIDDSGRVRKRLRRLPRSEWAIVIRDHHEGYVDWQTFEAIQARLATNTRPAEHQAGGAVREGAALLQGIAICGRCGRKLNVFYSGRRSSPGYQCPGDTIVNGRGKHCMRIGGRKIDEAVTSAFLASLSPAGMESAIQAAEMLEKEHGKSARQWRLQVERAQYEAQLAERRYRAVDPDNRLVARNLEAEWERCLCAAQDAQDELDRREHERPRTLSPKEREGILALGADLERVWSAPPVTDRDRKELLRTLLEEVIVNVNPETREANLVLRWRGGLTSKLCVTPQRARPAPNRTPEETVDLVRRLAAHYPDAVIAGILSRQGRKTSTGLSFNVTRVNALRSSRGIPRYRPPAEPPEGEILNVREAAKILEVSPGTIHRYLNDGLIPGEQLTPGAPWRIRITEELRSLFSEQPPDGYVPMADAVRLLGISRQTVLQRVKRGELQAVYVSRGRRKGLRIKVPKKQPGLFDE
jgi:DNA invertase Pin-like site-specific DNA recombinase